MSYKYGWAALNLEMTDKVPRTEYSTGYHRQLLTAVTGIPLAENADGGEIWRANKELMRIWDFSFNWNVMVNTEVFSGKNAHMGHAEYAENGSDKDTLFDEYYTDVEDVYKIDFDEMYGVCDINKYTNMFENHYKGSVSGYPDAVNMTGIYITCISGLIALLGWDMLLLAAGYDPKKFGEFVLRYNAWIAKYFEALAESDVPVVMSHDDMVWTSGAFLHPDFYRNFVFPHYKNIFGKLRESGKKVMFTSDGNFTEFIDDIAQSGVSGFVLEPMTDMSVIAEKYGKTHSFIGNADTRILLSGTKDDIYNEVKRCMDIGKKCPGFFMAVGNHIPANTPVDSCLWYNEFYEKLAKR